MKSAALFCLSLFTALSAVAREETATLPAASNAGISSIYAEKAVQKADQQNWSWRGAATLAIRQNQNWSAFENKTVLLKFDTTPIRGWTVKGATLHLALAQGDLYGVGACTVLGDWREGSKDGENDPGAPSWKYRAYPDPEKGATEEDRWAWPGSEFYSVTWLHPALRYSHAGPNQITRYTDADGVRWIKFPIDPALVQALAVNASYGLVLTDDKGQVAEANMLEKNPKPYVYDPSFEIQVYSRHAKNGALAPKLEVTGEAVDRKAPAAPAPTKGEPQIERASGVVTVEFVAPGDDGMTGCAQAYRARFSDRAITEANWAAATAIPLYALPLPKPAGEKQSLRLMTLKPGPWNVAVRAVDKAGNEGPMALFRVTVPAPEKRSFAEPKAAKAPAPKVALNYDNALLVWTLSDLQKANPLAKGKEAPLNLKEADGRKVTGVVEIKAAKNEVAAFQLVLEPLGDPLADLKVAVGDLKGPGNSLIPAAKCVELFREWSFPSDDKKQWSADACLPLSPPFRETFDVPAKDNVVEGQKNQAIWCDIYVPATAAPGEYKGTLTVSAAALTAPVKLDVLLTVRPFALPDESTWPVELNTYSGVGSFAGLDWNGQMARSLQVERAYYQLAQKHRCTLNVLRYTHAGNVTENAAPPVAGAGAEAKIADWTAWDARVGPLLDGSAFTEANGYYGPGMNTPVTHFYLPFHENWPLKLDPYYADTSDFTDRKGFAEWAKKSRRLEETVKPEYIAGYKKVAAEMARHFKDKGWTRTAFQVFMNNKYYYKCAFFVEPGLGMAGPGNGKCYWLLDEPVDFDDMDANRFFLSLAQQGFRDSGATGLRVQYRVDVSNPQMVRGLWDGVCNLWCSSVLSVVAPTANVRQKWVPGECWGTYGAGMDVFGPNVSQVQAFLNRYSMGATFVLPYWTNFGAGWRKADSTSIYFTGNHYAGTGNVYDGAIPGLRMKLLRRAQQDIEYLNLLAGKANWDRELVVRALSTWADKPEAVGGLSFAGLTEEKAEALRDAVAATIEGPAKR